MFCFHNLWCDELKGIFTDASHLTCFEVTRHSVISPSDSPSFSPSLFNSSSNNSSSNKRLDRQHRNEGEEEDDDEESNNITDIQRDTPQTEEHESSMSSSKSSPADVPVLEYLLSDFTVELSAADNGLFLTP